MLEPSVVFICIGNWTRSQMAEAYTRRYAGGWMKVASAGIQPAAAMHTMTVTVMNEAEEDMCGQYPKSLRDVLGVR